MKHQLRQPRECLSAFEVMRGHFFGKPKSNGDGGMTDFKPGFYEVFLGSQKSFDALDAAAKSVGRPMTYVGKEPHTPPPEPTLRSPWLSPWTETPVKCDFCDDGAKDCICESDAFSDSVDQALFGDDDEYHEPAPAFRIIWLL